MLIFLGNKTYPQKTMTEWASLAAWKKRVFKAKMQTYKGCPLDRIRPLDYTTPTHAGGRKGV